ncbi:GNAT family N-acetyltransferase [Chitinibacteraceae bacterium HSL-7]
MHTIPTTLGWPEPLLDEVVALYDAAFGAKLARAMPSRPARLAVLKLALRPEYAYVAFDDGKVIGVAGFRNSEGGMTIGVTWRVLLRALGWWQALRAAIVLSLYERTPGANELVLEGIAVAETHRSQGVGSRLLDCVIKHAHAHHFDRVRLDVVDSNPRARKLYEARGFIAEYHESYPLLRGVLGFAGSTQMVFDVSPRA